MYTTHFDIEEYPYSGVFYAIGIDDKKPLDQQVEEEIPVFETICDISEGSNISMDSFRVFFPLDVIKEKIVIKEGNIFSGEIYGANVRGRVIEVFPSQLYGCTVVLKRI